MSTEKDYKYFTCRICGQESCYHSPASAPIKYRRTRPLEPWKWYRMSVCSTDCMVKAVKLDKLETEWRWMKAWFRPRTGPDVYGKYDTTGD